MPPSALCFMVFRIFIFNHVNSWEDLVMLVCGRQFWAAVWWPASLRTFIWRVEGLLKSGLSLILTALFANVLNEVEAVVPGGFPGTTGWRLPSETPWWHAEVILQRSSPAITDVPSFSFTTARACPLIDDLAGKTISAPADRVRRRNVET